MSRKIRQHTGTFTATSGNGQRFTINQYTEFHEGHTSSGPYRVEGNCEYQTDEGEYVNHVSKGKYHHVPMGLDLVADDPNAP